MLNSLVAALLIVIPLYPKFPLLGVTGTFVSVRLEDFLVAGVFAVFLASSLRQRFSHFFSGSSRAILLYVGISLASLFSAVFLTKTVSINLGLLHAFRRIEYMSLFFVAFSALRDSKQLHFLIRTFLAVSLLVALYGLGQQFLNFPVISTTNSEFSKGLALSLGPGARINSTFAGHYDLAAFSLFPLLLILALLSLPTRHKWPLIITGGLIYWIMLLSASRVTFAAFFVTTALFLWIIRRRTWIVPLLILAVISILASPQLLGRYREFLTNRIKLSVVSSVQAAVDEEVPDALKPTAQPEDRSLNIRLNVEWPRALRALYKNPILGTGFSSVGLAVDNDYLRLLAETGIFGFAAFALVIIRFFKSSLPHLAPPRSLPQAFIVAVTCSLIGLLLNAVFIDVFEASKVALITWTFLGLAEKAKTLT